MTESALTSAHAPSIEPVAASTAAGPAKTLAETAITLVAADNGSALVDALLSKYAMRRDSAASARRSAPLNARSSRSTCVAFDTAAAGIGPGGVGVDDVDQHTAAARASGTHATTTATTVSSTPAG